MFDDYGVVGQGARNSHDALKSLLLMACAMPNCRRIEVKEYDTRPGCSLVVYQGDICGHIMPMHSGPRPIMAVYDLFSPDHMCLDLADDTHGVMGSDVVRIELVSIVSELAGERAIFELSRN